MIPVSLSSESELEADFSRNATPSPSPSPPRCDQNDQSVKWTRGPKLIRKTPMTISEFDDVMRTFGFANDPICISMRSNLPFECAQADAQPPCDTKDTTRSTIDPLCSCAFQPTSSPPSQPGSGARAMSMQSAAPSHAPIPTRRLSSPRPSKIEPPLQNVASHGAKAQTNESVHRPQRNRPTMAPRLLGLGSLGTCSNSLRYRSTALFARAPRPPSVAAHTNSAHQSVAQPTVSRKRGGKHAPKKGSREMCAGGRRKQKFRHGN